MGPRSDDRGNAKAQRNPTRHDLLQWGRDRMIAEMMLAAFQCLAEKALQWGRDRMIAEIFCRYSNIQRRKRFNGAAIG